MPIFSNRRTDANIMRPDTAGRRDAPNAALTRLARLPEHCSPDCGHALTQRDVAAALASLATRAAALRAGSAVERSLSWAERAGR